MEIAEGKGLNPYFEGQFDGESDELRALRLTLVRERDEAVAREREECALICDAEGREWDSDAVVTLKNYAEHCAAAIRARADNEVTK